MKPFYFINSCKSRKFCLIWKEQICLCLLELWYMIKKENKTNQYLDACFLFWDYKKPEIETERPREEKKVPASRVIWDYNLYIHPLLDCLAFTSDRSLFCIFVGLDIIRCVFSNWMFAVSICISCCFAAILRIKRCKMMITVVETM